MRYFFKILYIHRPQLWSIIKVTEQKVVKCKNLVFVYDTSLYIPYFFILLSNSALRDSLSKKFKCKLVHKMNSLLEGAFSSPSTTTSGT